MNDLKTKKVVTLKFTSEGQLKDDGAVDPTQDVPKVKKDEDSDSSDNDQINEQLKQIDYGYREQVFVQTEDDCFHKLLQNIGEDHASVKDIDCNMSILHSRYSEMKRHYEGTKQLASIPQDHAHPNFDYKQRFILCHNGLIANQSELMHDLEQNSKEVGGGKDFQQFTDSQIITALVSAEMDKNLSLKEALKNVVEVKLLGTYRIAAMETNEAKMMYLVKNSGEFSIGLSKDNDELVVSSDMEIFGSQYLGKEFSQISIPDNNLVEITSDCKYSFVKLEKKIVISRNPKAQFDHIM